MPRSSPKRRGPMIMTVTVMWVAAQDRFLLVADALAIELFLNRLDICGTNVDAGVYG